MPVIKALNLTFIVATQLVLSLFEFSELILLVDKLALVQVLQLLFALIMRDLKLVHLLLVFVFLLRFEHL